MKLLEVENLTKTFGGVVACNDITISINKGEIVGLIGPNGAGKTTLLSMIAGYCSPSCGSVKFNGKQIVGLKPNQICRLGVARTYQVVKPFGNLSVYRNVEVGAFLRAKNNNDVHERVERALEFTRLSEFRDKVARELPVGIRKRLEIARALATEPQLLLLDEAMAGLNFTELDEAIDIVFKIMESGVTLFVVEHIMKVIMSISHRVLVMEEGRLIADAKPTEVVKNPEVIRAYLGEPSV